ncbi:MAG: gamma-glutamyltransferase [Alphaproteobacteria bacterium]|nr:gamma-glutamyltransferase [Alphaproteobacteria bacterium]
MINEQGTLGNWTRGVAVALAAIIFIAGPVRHAAAEGAPVFATRHMVSAANPFAARAGLEILRRGGSAVDAAIAVQMVLNVVEPQSSGIGGGAFLLHFDAATRKVMSYDGRETAPAAATPALFLSESDAPLGFFDALVGGRAVGVPGVVRMLALAHQRQGVLPWRDLFASAIALSEEGFAISPRLHKLVASDRFLATYPETRRYFYATDGTAKPIGHLLKNPALAETLRTIAAEGADSFYEGSISRSVVFAVQSASDNPGLLTHADMSGYQAKARTPVCGQYRRFDICGMPPPTSGGVTTLQILGILQNANLAANSPTSPASAHLIAEASRLAFADRGKYLADPDFVDVPVSRLLDPAYLRKRYKQISLYDVMDSAAPGVFLDRRGSEFGIGETLELPSTTHFSIVDDKGNAVSMTSSVENTFGSRLMVRGFLLNNQLTDFSFRPDNDGVPVANRVEAGKRPRSSMSPMIVLDGRGRFRMAVGSPGGSRIIGYVVKTLVGVIDWQLDVQSAIDLPNITNRGRATEIERLGDHAGMLQALSQLGHDAVAVEMTSGIHAIVRDGRGLWGGADPRREGLAVGD